MMTITSAQAAFNWLSQEAEGSSSKRSVHYLFDIIYSAAKDDLGEGTPTSGLDLEVWEWFTKSLSGVEDADAKIAFSAPLSDFMGELLADLAMRGERGAVSVEQAVMMLISALDWVEHFELVPCGRRGKMLQSDTSLQRKHGVMFVVPISEQIYVDLHYCVG